jgi:hypothetical protein
VIIVEQAEPARDRGFLAERPHDEYAARDFSAAMCASVASTSVVSGARRTPYDSMEASQWEVD